MCILVDNVKETLSQLVQRRLKELNTSKAAVARKVGVSRSYIGNIANETAPTQSGQYNLSPDTVSGLAKALEINESEILEAMNYLPETKAKKKIATAADFAEFLQANNIHNFKLTEADMKKMEETGFDELIDYLKAFYIVKIERYDNSNGADVLQFPKNDNGKMKAS